MNLPNGRGVYTVVFRDDALKRVDARIVSVPHGAIDAIADKLRSDYGKNKIREDAGNGRADYLIAGVFVSTNLVQFPRSDVGADELSFVSETKPNLEILASSFGLPGIPEMSFVTYDTE